MARKTMRLEKGLWKEALFEDLREGDLFVLYEPSGDVVGADGNVVNCCTSRAVKEYYAGSKEPVAVVRCVPVSSGCFGCGDA